MDEQIPHGPKDLFCPMWKKSMSKVCHICPLWTKVVGKDPQSEKQFDRWNCSLSWLPILMIENSQMQRQTGAAVESFRNEVVRRSQLPSQENKRLYNSDNYKLLEQ